MHAFMAAVLLGMTGFDAFNTNPEPEPPDRKLTQVKQGVSRSEGNAIIAADVGGQAALLKTPLKNGESIIFPGGGERGSLFIIPTDLAVRFRNNRKAARIILWRGRDTNAPVRAVW